MKHNVEVDNVIMNNNKVTLHDQTFKKIEAKGECELNLFNCNIIDLNIEISDNSSLLINYFNLINKLDTKINVNANNKSAFILNHSFLNNEKYNLEVNTFFKSEEASITVNINGINDKGTLMSSVNGYVDNEKFNNTLDENMRVINLNNGKVTSNPNMYISTSKVIANHNTTIGSVREDELLYLMSKGINKENAIKLICKGFLTRIISNEEMCKQIKKEYEGGDLNA